MRSEVQDWLKVEEENSIAKAMEVAKFKIADMVIGSRHWNAVYLCGPPGIGKSFVTKQAVAEWRSLGLRPTYQRPKQGNQLIDLFFHARGRDPMIFEEADILFRSKPAFEILKKATDPDGERIHHQLREIEGEEVLVEIDLNVPLVVSTNKDLTEEGIWDADLLPDRDALFNRSYPVVFSDDPVELWEWSIYLALRSWLTAVSHYGRPEIPITIQSAAMTWLTVNAHRLKTIAPRTLKDAAQWMHRRHIGDITPAILDYQLMNMCKLKAGDPLPIADAEWSRLLTTTPKVSGKPLPERRKPPLVKRRMAA